MFCIIVSNSVFWSRSRSEPRFYVWSRSRYFLPGAKERWLGSATLLETRQISLPGARAWGNTPSCAPSSPSPGSLCITNLFQKIFASQQEKVGLHFAAGIIDFSKFCCPCYVFEAVLWTQKSVLRLQIRIQRIRIILPYPDEKVR